MPLAIVLTGGQRNDGAMLVEVLDDIRVPRLGPGRPRTRPEAVVADKAYSSGKTRKMLAARGVRSVIPQKSDEIASRQRKGSRGGRPPHLDKTTYAGRNVVERRFGLAKQRSEEHTSELQSRGHLVCRLLLEKKKTVKA